MTRLRIAVIVTFAAAAFCPAANYAHDGGGGGLFGNLLGGGGGNQFRIESRGGDDGDSERLRVRTPFFRVDKRSRRSRQSQSQPQPQHTAPSPLEQLNARSASIGKEIGRGLSEGSLTADEANNLLTESSRISSQLKQLGQNGSTPEQNELLSNQLDNLSKSLQQELTDSERAP